MFQNFFDIENIYGLGDFLATFILFPAFTVSYTIITMFWIYFIIKDYNQIKYLNNKLKIYDKKYNLNIIDSEENDFIQKFLTNTLKFYEKCFEINEDSICKIIFAIFILLFYIGYVIYKI
jgi:hypothetical protein